MTPEIIPTARASIRPHWPAAFGRKPRPGATFSLLWRPYVSLPEHGK